MQTETNGAASTLALAAFSLTTLGSCSAAAPTGDVPLPIAALEKLFQETRALRDAIDVTRSRGADATKAGLPITDLVDRYNGFRTLLQKALAHGALEGVGNHAEIA